MTVNTEAKVAKGTRSLLPRVWNGIVTTQAAYRQKSVVPEFFIKSFSVTFYKTP